MARIGVVSDIHGDVKALQDALKWITKFKCDQVICAGDLVDYWFYPNEVIDLLILHKVITVKGNHDRWSIGKGRSGENVIEDEDKEPYDASGWDLSKTSINFLANLPTKWSQTFDGIKVALCHGSPKSDMDGLFGDQMSAEMPFSTPENPITKGDRWLEEVDADVLIVGHTHGPFEASTSRGKIVNPGALLRERPVEMPHIQRPGTFGVLDLPYKQWTVYRAETGIEVEIPRYYPYKAAVAPVLYYPNGEPIKVELTKPKRRPRGNK